MKDRTIYALTILVILVLTLILLPKANKFYYLATKDIALYTTQFVNSKDGYTVVYPHFMSISLRDDYFGEGKYFFQLSYTGPKQAAGTERFDGFNVDFQDALITNEPAESVASKDMAEIIKQRGEYNMGEIKQQSGFFKDSNVYRFSYSGYGGETTQYYVGCPETSYKEHQDRVIQMNVFVSGKESGHGNYREIANTIVENMQCD